MVLKFKKSEYQKRHKFVSWEIKAGAEGWEPHIQTLAIGGKELPWDMKLLGADQLGLSSQSKRAGHLQRPPRSCGGSFDPGWDLILRRGNSYFLSPLDVLGGHNTELSSLTCDFFTSVGFWKVSESRLKCSSLLPQSLTTSMSSVSWLPWDPS